MQLREISAVHRNARVEKRKKEARTQRILKSTAVISSFDLSRSQFRFQRKKISTEGRNLVPREYTIYRFQNFSTETAAKRERPRTCYRVLLRA